MVESDCGRGGAYNLALNPDASRLYVVGESSWLDILDITDPSAIRSVNQSHVDGLPYGSDGEFGIAYDPFFQRLVAGGGAGRKVHLFDVRGDQLRVLDAAYPPERQFPAANFPPLIASPPIFVKGGNAVAVAMLTGGSADDPSSGQKVYFGEGITLLSSDPFTGKMSVVDEGIGGLSAVYGHAYDARRDMLWCGGGDGAEAVLDFSSSALSECRCWAGPLDEEGPRISPDVLTRDGRWLIERITSRFPANDWSLRIRQIEAANGEYSLWNADMPTDGASPRLLGSAPANWNSHAAPSRPLLPCVLTHDETRLLTAESGGNELLILDITDKTASPQFLFSANVGDGEEIQSIKGHRNRFYVSLKSGRIRVYQWGYVQKPDPPSGLSAVASPTDQSIFLSWTAPLTGVPPVGYNVYRRTAEISFKKVASVSETQWTDAATAEGETYFYAVRSCAPQYGPVESDDSPEVQATTASGIPPVKVLGLAAAPTLAGIILTWQRNPEDDVTGYLVYRRTEGALFEKITPSPVAEARFLDLDLLGGADYSYYVTAADSLSEGLPSDAVTATPADRTDNLLLNPGAEEQCTRGWVNASSIPAPDPANRYSFHNDLFIGVTDACSAEGQWAFWADQTKGRYDRETDTFVAETYLLAAYQDVDVTPFSSLIESSERNIVADWGGQVIRTPSEQSAIPCIAIEFLNTQQTVLARQELSSEKMGEWDNLSSSDPVPAGTVSLRFWMFAQEVKTAPANAAWDSLSLTLREEPPPQPPEVTLLAQPTGILVVLSVTSPSASYQIEYTDNLPAGANDWKPCGPVLIGNGSTIQWLDSPDEPANPTNPPAHSVERRFYRVRQQ
ncbi:MAG: hypothetical protein Q8Q12_20295 [bacterium]|nr:hypothetical protein [bacterium]